MDFSALLEQVLQGQELAPQSASELMHYLMRGEASDAQIGGLLAGLRAKGVTARELAAFAAVMREHAVTLRLTDPAVIDTCGTGGGCPSFNLSTAAAIVAAAAGALVAKHGNRAVTSSCGSADVLEACGVRLSGDHEQLCKTAEDVRLVFLFAPSHHPAMRHVGPARKALGVRTVFNQLGPLANPAGAARQLIGVYDPGMLDPMAEAAHLLGVDRVAVVHGLDGLDEISPCGATSFVVYWHGQTERGEWTPESFGLEPVDPRWIQAGETLEENAAILREAISHIDSPRARAVIPTAATALWLAGLEPTLPIAAERALEAIRDGKARLKLEELVEATQGL